MQIIPLPPISTLFPYTTLFRSLVLERERDGRSESLALKIPPERVAGLGDVYFLPRMRKGTPTFRASRSEEHMSELQSPCKLVCRLLLEDKNAIIIPSWTFSYR